MSEDAKCDDCSLPYAQQGDVSIPSDVWNKIHHAGGLLCANCLMIRLSQAGIGSVTAQLFPVAKIEGKEAGDA